MCIKSESTMIRKRLMNKEIVVLEGVDAYKIFA